MNKKKIAILSCVIILVCLGVFISLGYDNESPYEIPSVEDTFFSYDDCLIEVKGEVVRPGIYLVDENYCINDCIILAGGITKDGTTESLKLASKVSDGLTIVIPKKTTSSTDNTSKISLNSSSVTELTSIPGIGTAIANNIVKYRQEHGDFTNLEELLNVQRISENLFNKIKEYLTL